MIQTDLTLNSASVKDYSTHSAKLSQTAFDLKLALYLMTDLALETLKTRIATDLKSVIETRI